MSQVKKRWLRSFAATSISFGIAVGLFLVALKTQNEKVATIALFTSVMFYCLSLVLGVWLLSNALALATRATKNSAEYTETSE